MNQIMHVKNIVQDHINPVKRDVKHMKHFKHVSYMKNGKNERLLACEACLLNYLKQDNVSTKRCMILHWIIRNHYFSM